MVQCKAIASSVTSIIFVVGIVKTCGNFAEMKKKPEMVLRC